MTREATFPELDVAKPYVVRPYDDVVGMSVSRRMVCEAGEGIEEGHELVEIDLHGVMGITSFAARTINRFAEAHDNVFVTGQNNAVKRMMEFVGTGNE
jgi:hypothetical protein